MKKIKWKKEPYLIGFSIITLLPIIIFIFKFKNNPISEYQGDWAEFGTYFSGILTPIISIFSFIILAFIYYEIEKNSNENDHNLYVLEKKMEVFEKLQSYRHDFNQLTIKLHQARHQLKSDTYIADNKLKNEINLREIKDITNKCVDFNSFIKNFKIRYSHIFKNDFNSDTFQNLVRNINILESDILQLYFDLLKRNTDKYKEGEQPFWNFQIILNELEKFSEELKFELKKH